MKKILFLLIGLSILASCTDSDDDFINGTIPTGGKDLYFATPGFPGYPEMIYNLDGDTIYQCAEGYHIYELLGDGSDWYASLRTEDGIHSVLKDSKTIYMTEETIWCMAVENGIVYTVQENRSDHTVWVYKDFERIYELDRNVNFNTICVNNGNVSFTVFDSKPYTWWNGYTTSFEKLDEGYGYTFGYDRSGYDVLITYESALKDGKYMYWWNGKNYDMPEMFFPSTSRLINGHAFILGAIKRTLSSSGAHYVPAVIIDGMVTILNDEYDFAAKQVVADGMNTYILVNDVSGRSNWSLIYKNLQCMDLPNNIVVPENLRKYYAQSLDDDGATTTLINLGITAIAVVKNDKQ